ncbi:LINE-1 retrotransposable element ORF2 protein [Cucumis melo var. makuwa]|uniref:LINE-1 retrotransposable element ORF2 protein n=1 Tax=Cucumis melo var. makuwa TaxID=1194695 RepID=A0A5D3D847_CUCMM|nr:LINE-1 retrotransposable element ORF2 protein [Cucumis melo var. makuwa]TYK19712.1 LINE-1 retrotransposable element ORF2 protein [Cucumis melo var. makuwa]
MAKAIANRLKSTLPLTITPNKLSFVQGRQITDAILMANETVDYWLTSKFKGGLRQGDPISPFIFVIAMDYLSRLLTQMQNNGVIKAIVFDKNCELYHLLYVDDILIFIEDDNRAIKSLQKDIFLFEAASGLTINRSRSSITPINIPINRSNEVANLCNIPTKPFPVDYLRVPLLGKPNSKGLWTNIVDKIQKKLNDWKYSQLSKGGKLTLIQASLSSLPTYQLSVFKAPIGVGKSNEKHWRDFLWKNIK